MCCGDPAAFDLWFRFLSMLQEIIMGWMGIRVGQVITLVLGLDRCVVGLRASGSLTPISLGPALLSHPDRYGATIVSAAAGGG